MADHQQTPGEIARREKAVVRLWTAVNDEVIAKVKTKFPICNGQLELVNKSLEWWKDILKVRPHFPQNLPKIIEKYKENPCELIYFQFSIVDETTDTLVYWSLSKAQFTRHQDSLRFPYNEKDCLFGIVRGESHVKGFDDCTCAITQEKWGLGWCAATNTALYISDLRKYQEAQITAEPETDYLWGVGSCIYLPISRETAGSLGGRSVLGVLVLYSPIHGLFGPINLVDPSSNATLPAHISQVRKNLEFFDGLRKSINTGPLSEFVVDKNQDDEESDAAVLNRARDIGNTIIGISNAVRQLREETARFAPRTSNVLITGESGSGKELVAKSLHDYSSRKEFPFVAINTANMPEEQLESELFGHERGAFTNAYNTRRGRFEQANGGTLFLDEIGDMPARLQTRLLRVLSDGHFYRVGGSVPIESNVRVIAATHHDLEECVEQGSFRRDLYYRLNVLRLRVPPLRARAEDIPALTRHLLNRAASEDGVEPKRLLPQVQKHLCTLTWPGNVRQLENICKHLTAKVRGRVARLEDLPPELFHARTEIQPASSASPPVMAHASSTAHGPAETAPDALSTGITQDNLADAIKQQYAKSLRTGSVGEKEKLQKLLANAMWNLEEQSKEITGEELAQFLGIHRNYLYKNLLGHIGIGMPELKKYYRSHKQLGHFDNT